MNQEQIEQEVTRLVDARATAELQSDTAFLERLLSDDFVGIEPLGFLPSEPAPILWKWKEGRRLPSALLSAADRRENVCAK
jgi:hypothetical protein